jgi:hypothetical protein
VTDVVKLLRSVIGNRSWSRIVDYPRLSPPSQAEDMEHWNLAGGATLLGDAARRIPNHFDNGGLWAMFDVVTSLSVLLILIFAVFQNILNVVSPSCEIMRALHSSSTPLSPPTTHVRNG